jgi:hypothetical protein
LKTDIYLFYVTNKNLIHIYFLCEWYKTHEYTLWTNTEFHGVRAGGILCSKGLSTGLNFFFTLRMLILLLIFSLQLCIETISCIIYGLLNIRMICVYSIEKSKNVKIKVYRAIILPLVLLDCETW